MKVEKYNNISFMKVTMMFLVVIYHSLLFFGGTWFTVVKVVHKSDILYKIALLLNSFHIPSFTMASGFLFFYSKSRKKNKSHKENIIKKVKRLLIPYFFIGLLWVVPIKIIIEKVNMINYVKLFILGIAGDQLWFLMMLFIVFLIFELFTSKIAFSRKDLLLSIFIFSLLYYVYDRYKICYFQIHNVCKYLPFFCLGGYIYSNLDKYRFTKKQLFVLVMIACISSVLQLINNSLFKLFVLQIFSMSLVIIIYMLCDYIVKKYKNITNNKIYLFFEKYSFGIYLFHQQIIHVCIILLNGRVYPLTQVLVTTIVSICISIFITYLLLGSRVTRCLIGYE